MSNPPMYILVSGKRDFTNYALFRKELDIVKKHYSDRGLYIVEGGAKGTDALAKRYAMENNLPYKEFPADWDKYGKKAGPIRNKEMVDFVAANYGISIFFWDGKSKGTENCLKIAKERIPWKVVWLC